MSRRTRTTIPTLKRYSNLKLSKVYMRQQAKAAYDKSARPLPELQIEEPVRLQPVNPKAPWDKGSCVAKVGPRSYLIETDNGNLYRRNRKFIRQDPSQGHQQPIITDRSSTNQSSPLPKPADVHPEPTAKEERKSQQLILSLQEVAESAFAHQDSQTTFNRRFMS